MAGFFIKDEAELEERKKKLRERLGDLYQEAEFLGMGSVAVSEVLIRSAFAWRDWNGGIDDTRHAAKVLRELVDEIEAERINGELASDSDADEEPEE